MSSIEDKVSYIRSIYSDANIDIHKDSYLNKLLNSVQNYPDTNIPIQSVFKKFHIQRIHLAISTLIAHGDEPKIHCTLKDLLDGDLDFHNLVCSKAKNLLFELELASKLSGTDTEINLLEPDIRMKTNGRQIAIACKKIMSVKNLNKIIQGASRQIERQNLDYGIIALNIDYIIPTNHIIKADNYEDALKILRVKIDTFIVSHKQLLVENSSKNRIIGVLIICTIAIDIKEPKNGMKIVNLTDSTFVTSTNKTEEEKQILYTIKNRLSYSTF